MAKKSKFFRVAVEGATTDGRAIPRAAIEQMGRNYDRNKFGARIFLEHIRGIDPSSLFRAYGDIVATKSEEVEINGVTKLALFAQVEPTDDLIKLAAAKQKVYTSIEFRENFAGTGEAYLEGLGITDSPASLGVELMTFAAQHPDANPLTGRKHHPDNSFSAAEEVTLEFDDVADPGPTLLARVKDMFARKGSTDDQRFTDAEQAVEAIAGTVVEYQQATATTLAELRNTFTTLQGKLDAATANYAQLTEQINGIADTSHRRRPPATGGNGAVVTDC